MPEARVEAAAGVGLAVVLGLGAVAVWVVRRRPAPVKDEGWRAEPHPYVQASREDYMVQTPAGRFLALPMGGAALATFATPEQARSTFSPSVVNPQSPVVGALAELGVTAQEVNLKVLSQQAPPQAPAGYSGLVESQRRALAGV